MHGKEKVIPLSAESKPSGIINLKAIKAMQAIGYDLPTHFSKSVDEFRNEIFDYVIHGLW